MRLPYQEDEPRIIVRIFSPLKKESIPFVAYVDSGASYSIFHEDVAELLGIQIKNGRKTQVTVGNGARIPVYLHRLNVQFATEEFLAVIGFSPKLGVEINLLGQIDFFDRFKICFDSKNKYLEVNKI